MEEEIVIELVPKHPQVPQDSLSLDASGSTAHFFRASGDDLLLTKDDLIGEDVSHSSSSFDEVAYIPTTEHLAPDAQAGDC